MSVVGDNIRALRTLYGEGRDITQVELAEIIGVTRETVNKWEAGTIGNVRTSNINRLREHFGLSVDDLRSESNGLAAKLRAIQGTGTRANERRKEELARACVPVLPLSCLQEGLREAEASQLVEVPVSLTEHHPRSFAFVVEDASMARVLPEGCHAVADPDHTPTSGSIVVACVPEEQERPVVRRLHRGSTKAMLSSEGTKASPDLVYENEDVRVIGTVVWYQAAGELG